MDLADFVNVDSFIKAFFYVNFDLRLTFFNAGSEAIVVKKKILQGIKLQDRSL